MTAGGLPQDATWKYFYNKKDPYSSGTSAWRGAKQLYDYLLKDPKRATKVPIEYMIDAYKNKPGAWCVLRWGDLVFLNRNKSGSLKHAMIITHSYNDLSNHYKGTPRYTLSAHTNDCRDVDITGLDFDFDYLKRRGLGVKIEYWILNINLMLGRSVSPPFLSSFSLAIKSKIPILESDFYFSFSYDRWWIW